MTNCEREKKICHEKNSLATRWQSAFKMPERKRQRSLTFRDTCRGCGMQKFSLARHFWWSPSCRNHHEETEEACLLPDLEEELELPCATQRSTSRVLRFLNDWTTKVHVGDTHKDVIKADIAEELTHAANDIEANLVHKFGDAGVGAAEMVRERLDIFQGVSTAKQELAECWRTLPMLKFQERKVGPKADDLAYSLVLRDWLQKLIQHDTAFRVAMLTSSDLWKTGKLRTEPAAYDDIIKGLFFRQHQFSRRAEVGEENDLRALFVMSYDDCEFLDGFGVVRGKKKAGLFYVSLVNLGPDMRFLHKYIGLLMVVLTKVLMRCGAVRVVAGASGVTGEIDETDWASFGAQLRASLAGRLFVAVRASPKHIVPCP